MGTNLHACPHCGREPSRNPEFCDGYVVWCDNDACPPDTQAWAKTEARALEKWEEACLLGFEAPDA